MTAPTPMAHFASPLSSGGLLRGGGERAGSPQLRRPRGSSRRAERPDHASRSTVANGIY